jgi:folate-binding protein YgfZ
MNDIITLLKQQKMMSYKPKRAIFSIKGPDAKEFLQRMSTNDMNGLMQKPLVETCFLNNKGRIVDYVCVIARDVNDYLLISSYADTRLMDWLENFHFVEDFTLSVSQCIYNIIVCINNINYNKLWSSDFVNFFVTFNLDHNTDMITLSDEQWETLRIAAQMPALSEVDLALMPHNIGLLHTIAEHKGCYLGQEVIAKSLTYQKQIKRLVGLKLSEERFLEAKKHGHEEFISLAPFFIPGIINALAIKRE